MADSVVLQSVVWRKSSFSSGHGGNCVEVAPLSGLTAVRDSKDPGGGALVFRRPQWSAFLAATRDGAFELP